MRQIYRDSPPESSKAPQTGIGFSFIWPGAEVNCEKYVNRRPCQGLKSRALSEPTSCSVKSCRHAS